MKSIMMFFGLLLVSTSAFASFSSGGGTQNWPSNGNYYCKAWGDRVCAVKKTTGQCTFEWKKESGGGDPMFFCKKHIGLDVGRVKKENLFCRDMGGYVCAASKIHGQCTMSWDKETGGGDAMFFCKKYLGQGKSNWKPTNYVCKKSGDRVCAQDIRTGQCTHEWTREDSHDPLLQCQRFLRR